MASVALLAFRVWAVAIFLAGPIEQRHHLSIASAHLGADRGGCLLQAVRRALRQFGLIAPLAHLVVEATIGVCESHR
jgi:hypothetical protein